MPLRADPSARAVVALLLMAHAVLFSWCAIHKSICVDEGAHLSAGVTYWKWRELSIYNLSPPLMRYWDSIPAYLSHCVVPEAKSLRDDSAAVRQWVYYDRFEKANAPRLFRYVILGRFMQLPISLALAIGIWWLARSWYGEWSAVLACGVYCLEPTILAHASTLGTDLGITAALFASVVAWMRFLKTGKLLALMLAGLAVGAAHAIKFNAALIWPVLLLMVFLTRRFREGLIGLCLLLVICYVLLNLSYGYAQFGKPLGSFGFQSHLMQSLQKHLPGKLPLPFSKFMVEGFDVQKWEADGGYVSVLFGKARFGADWRYYPYLLLCKTPLTVLALIGFTTLSLFRRRPGRMEVVLVVMVLTFLLGMMFLTQINLGIRYLLPIYPPAIVLLARAIRPRWVWLLIPLAIETCVAAPWFHSYTNLAARGFYIPDQDYDQSLTDVRDWMRSHDMNQITLLSVGWTDPGIYGIHLRKLSQPPSEFVAISKTFLMGVPCRFHPEGCSVLVRNWRNLQRATPVADLGGIEIFRREDVGPEPWIRVTKAWSEGLDDPMALPLEGWGPKPATNAAQQDAGGGD